MSKIIGISFTKKGKIYNFDSKELNLKIDDKVIVETEKGLQYGYVMKEVKDVDVENLDISLKPVLRIATERDNITHKKNLYDANKALLRAKNLVEELKLDMRLLDACYTFDRKQLLFNFIADERIDFRELAKKLAQIYKTRIELRQIGIRDKAKEIGGLGPCGRMLCCNTFLTDLNSVTINMAKNQMLALNPTKINGVCGRLLCCLNYEDEVYTDLKKNLPNIGDHYQDEQISGKIVNIDILKQKIYIENENNNISEVYINNGNN